MMLFGAAAATFVCIVRVGSVNRPVSAVRYEKLRRAPQRTYFVRPVPASMSFAGAEYCAFGGLGTDCCEVQRAAPFALISGSAGCVELP
jgi:hypothetical protein